MTNDIARTENLLGAFALAITDKMREETEKAAGQGGMVPAALVQVGGEPGQSIDHLRRCLGLSHSATVRVVMQLEEKGWLLKTRSHAQDARMATLNLTAAGEVVRARVLAARQGLLQSVMKTLPGPAHQHLTNLLELMLPRLIHSSDAADHVCRLCDLQVCPQDICPAEPEKREA